MYRNLENKKGLAATKMIEEIRAKDYSLSIPLYVEKVGVGEKVKTLPIEDAYEGWSSSARTSELSFRALLSELSQGEIL